MIALISISGTSFAQSGCPTSCCGGGSFDMLFVTLIDMRPREPIGGWIELRIDIFATFEDGCDQPVEFILRRECGDELAGLLHPTENLKHACMVICGSPADCPENIGCFGCPNLYSHSCDAYTVLHPLWGKGKFIVVFKGIEVFSQEFDYPEEDDIPIMEFTDIRFLNKDFSEIQYNDIFDAMEAVAIQVAADFEGDEPAQAVGVKLKSDLTSDSIIINLPLEGSQWNTATYSGRLMEGLFLDIIGDPEQTLPPFSQGEIIATPILSFCESQEPSTGPEDILPIANFVLWVEEISFEFDEDLSQDGPGPTPGSGSGVPILDPVWIKDTKNEPVAYIRENTLSMNVVVESNRTPYHDFQYWIMGAGGSGQGTYSTGIYEGNFNSTNLSTICYVAPRDGPFPDYVGIIDPLNYNWYGNKVGNPDLNNFKFMNSSSHKIYLTYDTPLLAEINIIALDKICDYAQGENEPSAIAELGVGGVYGEGWTYNPNHPVFPDPLDVIRQRIGQCADYANLLTYLYKSIGIPANSVTIYNSATFLGTEYRLFWIYSLTYGRVCILSKELTSCNGTTKEWPFNYHVTSYAAGMLCDAALEVADTRANYDSWWKYYLHPRTWNPPYSHDEPPPFEPTYYDWPEYTPQRPVPPHVDVHHTNFYHP